MIDSAAIIAALNELSEDIASNVAPRVAEGLCARLADLARQLGTSHLYTRTEIVHGTGFLPGTRFWATTSPQLKHLVTKYCGGRE